MNIELTILLSEIRSDLQAIEDNADIYDETHFSTRADTIDFIDFHIISRIEGLLLTNVPTTEFEILKQRAEHAKHRLEEVDNVLFKQLREQIRSGSYAQASFKAMVRRYLDEDYNQPNKIGYDNQDAFINGLLTNQPLPEATIEQQPEMVFYQQTPARVIFEMADRARLTPNDVFFDLGSGLGQVAILINLLTGAKARGVEYEPAYCDYATSCASNLNLADVKFINTTAQNGNYAEGTVFFMYTPFEGVMLQEMLDILKKEAQQKTIRIFTYGPCSPNVARQSWLSCVNGAADSFYALYEFRSTLVS
jgi:hypothetical protein